MIKTNNNQYGILRELQKAITYYAGIKVILRNLDDAFTVLFEDEKEMQGFILPKKDGHVEDNLFRDAVNYLQDILKESAA